MLENSIVDATVETAAASTNMIGTAMNKVMTASNECPPALLYAGIAIGGAALIYGGYRAVKWMCSGTEATEVAAPAQVKDVPAAA